MFFGLVSAICCDLIVKIDHNDEVSTGFLLNKRVIEEGPNVCFSTTSVKLSTSNSIKALQNSVKMRMRSCRRKDKDMF